MVNETHLGGNSKPPLIPNRSSGDAARDRLINECSKEAYGLFFERFGYCDAGIDGDEVRIGIEPAYEFEPLKLLILCPDISECRFVTGRAVESWAARILSTSRSYGDYQRASKFTRFVSKWHPILFAAPRSQ